MARKKNPTGGNRAGIKPTDHLGLLWMCAHKMHGKYPRLEAGDFVGWGWRGLVFAIDQFDPTMGYKFNTYAARCIFGYMHRGLEKEAWIPRGTITSRTARGTFIPQIGSLDDKVGGSDQRTIGSMLPDVSQSPDDRLSRQDDVQQLRRLLAKLSDYERWVLICREVEGRTLQDLAEERGVCKERIRQIEVRAIEKMRHWADIEDRRAAREARDRAPARCA